MKKAFYEEGDRVRIIDGRDKGCEGKIVNVSNDTAMVHLLSKNGESLPDNTYCTVFSSQLESLEEVKKKKSNLQMTWEKVCHRYLFAFCRRHDYTYDPDNWIGGDVGTTIEVCDMFIHMDDIRYDVDNNVPVSLFAEWYWKDLEVYELTDGREKYMNFPSYCKGAPDNWTPERLEALKEGKRRVREANEALEKIIKDLHENVSNVETKTIQENH